MSTLGIMQGPAGQPPVRRRAPGLLLPEDPNPEELVQYWTLSARSPPVSWRGQSPALRRATLYAAGLRTLCAGSHTYPRHDYQSSRPTTRSPTGLVWGSAGACGHGNGAVAPHPGVSRLAAL
jgi:hypothetical protein